jgi:ankyrin repeat protein
MAISGGKLVSSGGGKNRYLVQAQFLINGFVFILTVLLLVNATFAQKQEATKVMDRISNFLAAAESGDTSKIAESLNQGTEIDVTDEHGQTALMLAAYEGHVDTVKLLLQHGASHGLQNRFGGTALMLASFNGHLEVVTELLKAGADVNAKSKNGYTALMQAAVKPNEAAVQIINLLLDQKADINAQDNEGYTALMRAVDHPSPPPPLPPFLRGAKKPKWYDRKQREAEIHLMVVKALVMRGADLNSKDQRGRTALEISRMNHLTHISEFLESR